MRTTLEALGQGNAVLNGRYGPSIELAYNPADLPAAGIRIHDINFQILAASKELWPLYVVIRSIGNDDAPLLVEKLRELPEPLLYVSDHVLSHPYDYDNWSSSWTPIERGSGGAIDAIRIRAWAQASWLRSAARVLFRIPFCGARWAASTVLQSSESLLQSPASVVRLGSDGTNTALIIPGRSDFAPTQWVAQIDADYSLQFVDSRNLLFSVPSNVLANYSKLILKSAAGTYLLDIPGDSQRH